MINETPLSLGVKDYLKNNISTNEKILISISCGLDSTVLFDLITKSKYLKSKNIYYLIFDHQKRPEGKYEIKQLIHGHTHRPLHHKESHGDRWVLGAWEKEAWILEITEDEKQLNVLPI